MSGTLSTLSIDLTNLARNLGNNIDKAIRMAALAIDQAVVLATPVDTGRARSNWLVSVGNPNLSMITAYYPGSAGSTGSNNVSAALTQAQNAVGGYRTGETIYISNNLPYIQMLNSGSSRQAPADYVLTAVLAASSALQNIRLLP